MTEDFDQVITKAERNQIDIYMANVARRIDGVWKSRCQVMEKINDPTLITKIVFSVLPNGEIVNIYYTEKSGNKAFDEMVGTAVVSASPVKPHPKNLNRPYLEMGMVFSSEGVK